VFDLQLDFRENALDGMRERRIQPAEVIYTVEHPEVTRESRSGRLMIYEAHPNGRLIIVSVDTRNPRWVSSVKDYR